MPDPRLTKTLVPVADIEAVIKRMEEREQELLKPEDIVYPDGAKNADALCAARAAGIRDVLASLRQLIKVTP